jgi:hypothetical protein
MPAIVQFPTVVQDALDYFGPLFINQPERQHLGEYVTGLMTAYAKSVCGISREFPFGSDQSCLNRWLNETNWDPQELNRMRLQWLQEDPSTRYSIDGVIAIDNVLVNHDGELIEDVGCFWDHAEKRYLIAHDYVIANYVTPDGKNYPLEYRRFIKEEQCRERRLAFVNHEQLLRELVDWCVQMHIPGTFTFDSWFTCPDNLNHIHQHHRAYVGELKFNRHLEFQIWNSKARTSRPRNWPGRLTRPSASPSSMETPPSGTSPARCVCPRWTIEYASRSSGASATTASR